MKTKLDAVAPQTWNLAQTLQGQKLLANIFPQTIVFVCQLNIYKEKKKKNANIFILIFLITHLFACVSTNLTQFC